MYLGYNEDYIVLVGGGRGELRGVNVFVGSGWGELACWEAVGEEGLWFSPHGGGRVWICRWGIVDRRDGDDWKDIEMEQSVVELQYYTGKFLVVGVRSAKNGGVTRENGDKH